ncbi:uncharacterized protein [Centruroides vittatus]|uniref:uncharacterized protein n=1 Tax=Centruroides vittatus TaxID=120091 RepID=UPI00350F6FD8
MIRTEVIFTIFCLSVSFYASADNCDKDILTTCANVIEFMSKRQSVIAGKEMIDDLCRFSKNATICADNLAKDCPQIKEKEQYKTLIRVNQKVETDVCEENSDIRKIYAKHEDCLHKITDDKALQCAQDFIVILRLLDESSDKEVCCSYTETKECIHKLVSSNCGNDAANATVHVADLLTTPLTEPRCSTFNVTKCSKDSASSRSNPSIYIVVFVFLFSLLF